MWGAGVIVSTEAENLSTGPHHSLVLAEPVVRERGEAYLYCNGSLEMVSRVSFPQGLLSCELLTFPGSVTLLKS